MTSRREPAKIPCYKHLSDFEDRGVIRDLANETLAECDVSNCCSTLDREQNVDEYLGRVWALDAFFYTLLLRASSRQQISKWRIRPIDVQGL